MSLAYLSTEAVKFNPVALKESESRLYGGPTCSASALGEHIGDFKSEALQEIIEARKRINATLKGETLGTGASSSNSALEKRFDGLEKENKQMRGELDDLKLTVKALEQQIKSLTLSAPKETPREKKPSESVKEVKKEASDDDEEDIDLFGSDEDEDDDEKERIKEERLKAYAEKKSKKPGLIAKSSVILDVKPWDDETDMKVVEEKVREIEFDGLRWGAGKLVPLAYGILKLQIICIVEDDKVSIEELTEKIEEIEDLVQSVDIAAFNKI